MSTDTRLQLQITLARKKAMRTGDTRELQRLLQKADAVNGTDKDATPSAVKDLLSRMSLLNASSGRAQVRSLIDTMMEQPPELLGLIINSVGASYIRRLLSQGKATRKQREFFRDVLQDTKDRVAVEQDTVGSPTGFDQATKGEVDETVETAEGATVSSKRKRKRKRKRKKKKGKKRSSKAESKKAEKKLMESILTPLPPPVDWDSDTDEIGGDVPMDNSILARVSAIFKPT